MAKLFLDTNIVLDILIKREPHYLESRQLIDLAIEDDRIKILIAECSLANIIYLTQKEIKTGLRGIDRIIAFLESYSVLSVLNDTYIRALESPFKDKEDALQYHVALQHQCDYFITRDESDYKPFASKSLPVVSPAQFLKDIEPPGQTTQE